MQGLDVYVDGCVGGEEMGLVVHVEELGVRASGFGNENDGAVEAEGFVLGKKWVTGGR